jgi:peptidyl-prolyl cis-trans isomerase B (cyclophilin B)
MKDSRKGWLSVLLVGSLLLVGASPGQPDIPTLERGLTDPRDAIRAVSIYKLGLIGLGSDAGPITAAALTDRSGAVRIAAIDALGRYEEAKTLDASQEHRAATALADLLDGGAEDPLVRGRAAIAVNWWADGADAPLLAARLTADFDSEQNAGVRERIMWTVFRRFAAKVPVAFLRAGLNDKDEVVRIEAARAYGRLKDPALAVDLKPLLDDPSWRVQEQAAESIRVLGGGTLTEHWTSIPAFVHTPAPIADPYAQLPAMPRMSPLPGPPHDVPAQTAWRNVGSAASMLTPSKGLHPRVRIVTTQGNIYLALYPEWAPGTVANFLNLTNRGFYDDNPWFRIVPDFVVQTGEQDAKNAPGPGYSILNERNPLEQNSYVISMGLDYDEKTNTPKLDSAGSEYYITLSPQYHLDNAFTVFGAVISGVDVLGRLSESDKVIRIERIADVAL